MKPPVEVTHLFPVIDEQLIGLLRSLSKEQWRLPTLAKRWTVKDVAAHLLDGNMRTISASHNYDGPPPPPITSYTELVSYLNDLNAVFVNAMQRISPQLIVELLENTGKQYSSIMASAPLFEPARFSVSWAGEETSMNWFHIAREYTEKMHHQLQIRHAVNRESDLMTHELFYPFIDTLMYGLPHALRNTNAIENTSIAVTITGEIGGTWYVLMKNERWTLIKDFKGDLSAHVFIEPNLAWKRFTRGISTEDALSKTQTEGDLRLCKAVLGMVAVMA